MRFSLFFIDRPIFAAVISILLTLLGAVSYFGLPVTQYPEIAPPTIQISATYPGASAEVVSDTVATPIEQEINGIEGMLYRCIADVRGLMSVHRRIPDAPLACGEGRSLTQLGRRRSRFAPPNGL